MHFQLIRDAIRECTSFDLIEVFDDDEECMSYIMIDSCGDQYGDCFYELDDVVDLIENNEQVAEYLNTNNNTEAQ